jgi:hypothetical protein
LEGFVVVVVLVLGVGGGERGQSGGAKWRSKVGERSGGAKWRSKVEDELEVFL